MTKRIDLLKSENLFGESGRCYDDRLENGFWNKYVRAGTVIDIGYNGGVGWTPIFKDAVGIDLDTPGYDGKNFPFPDNSIGTIHASHLLEHIADYTFFFIECFRVLKAHGTLILFVPIMDFYEQKATPPSRWNPDHKRFYTAFRLIYEIETSLPRTSYRVVHLCERFLISDYNREVSIHAAGPYEIECVIEKINDEK